MKDKGIDKIPRCSWIEVNKRVHDFLIENKSHLQIEEIFQKSKKVLSEMNAMGYITNTIPMFWYVEFDNIKLLLYQHSEKLAITFRLLKTAHWTIIKFMKNIWVYDGYHITSKFISNIVARVIVMRDGLVHAFR